MNNGSKMASLIQKIKTALGAEIEENSVETNENTQTSTPTELEHDYFLVNRFDILEICKQYIKKLNAKSILGAIDTLLLGAIISAIISGDGFKSNALFWICFGIWIVITLVWFIMRKKQKRNENVLEVIYKKALENADYNALFLITRNIPSEKPSEKSIQIMTTPHDENGITPYIVYQNLKEGSIIQNKKIIHDELIKVFADKLDISAKGIRIKKVQSFYEIKRTSSYPTREKMIMYEYFETSIPAELREKVEEKCQWKILNDLRDNPAFMSRNAILYKDICKYFTDADSIHESFYKTKDFKPIKIIWNITSKCGYNCEICATHRENEEELSLAQKSQLLLSVLSLEKDGIREIDFSGGDPLIDPDNWQIIQNAQQVLGKEKVCVTTTGNGIEKVKNERRSILHDLLYNCEITIDEPDDNDTATIREQKGYAFNNRQIIHDNINQSGHLTVNVPILDWKKDEAWIRELVRRIHDIGENIEITCALLRLMPSGKLSNFDNYPSDYNPVHFIRTFEEEAKKYSNLKVHEHCALQCYLKNGNNCNMLNEKVGIDNQGNVFACAWGGYINSITDLTQNPFYLGNALEERLIDILNSKRAKTMREKIEAKTPCCRLFNYYLSKPRQIYSNKDKAKLIREEMDHA